MTVTERKIKMAAAYSGMSQAEIARSIGMSPSNFSQKLKRDTFTPDEMERIAEALGGKWVARFEFPDGTAI
ncbi:MAG: helix-turn-helix domain-containing protein [Oscillospiraceae bacterium]|nr:helix-turn-helix domain-containing protein [Oscillospiraceae bacterium]